MGRKVQAWERAGRPVMRSPGRADASRRLRRHRQSALRPLRRQHARAAGRARGRVRRRRRRSPAPRGAQATGQLARTSAPPSWPHSPARSSRAKRPTTLSTSCAWRSRPLARPCTRRWGIPNTGRQHPVTVTSSRAQRGSSGARPRCRKSSHAVLRVARARNGRHAVVSAGTELAPALGLRASVAASGCRAQKCREIDFWATFWRLVVQDLAL